MTLSVQAQVRLQHILGSAVGKELVDQINKLSDLSQAELDVIDGATVSTDELNQLDGAIFNDLETTAGVGITSAAATIVSRVEKVGTLFKTTVLIDLTGLNSGANANDIIGAEDADDCHLGQITAARNGTIFAGQLECLETPAGGDDDIDLWNASESTGTEDADIEDEVADDAQLCNSGDLTAGTVVQLTAFPTADYYLYLAAGTGDTNDTYTAGVLLITLWGK